MCKGYKACGIILALFLSQSAFAGDSMGSSMDESMSCQKIVKACLDGGYTRENTQGSKNFWFDCMRPILLGKTVEGVTIDPKDATTCKKDKITEMQKELNELKQK